jgi:hypothetical protein
MNVVRLCKNKTKHPKYLLLNYLHDQVCGILSTQKITSVPFAFSGDGPAALTTITPTSINSQKDTKGRVERK